MPGRTLTQAGNEIRNRSTRFPVLSFEPRLSLFETGLFAQASRAPTTRLAALCSGISGILEGVLFNSPKISAGAGTPPAKHHQIANHQRRTPLPLALQSLSDTLYRLRHLWAVVSFALGLGSYFLVDRQPWLAAVLTGFLVLSWVLLLSEGLWQQRFVGTAMEGISQGALKLMLQAVHQEAFFFSLPFVLLQWSGGAEYILFTTLVISAALMSIIDPIYFWLARHRALYFGFHAWALFVALLVLLPLIFQWETDKALTWSGWLTALFALPSFWRVGGPRKWFRWLGLVAVSAVIALAPRWLAPLVPPLTLSLQERAMALSFNREQRLPLVTGEVFSASEVEEGLYAYTAIKAPLGLGQEVYHYWFQNGERVDRIPLKVFGGRDSGFRTWSHKRHVPQPSAGHWRVEVRTEDNQIIGVMRFVIEPDA